MKPHHKALQYQADRQLQLQLLNEAAKARKQDRPYRKELYADMLDNCKAWRMEYNPPTPKPRSKRIPVFTIILLTAVLFITLWILLKKY